MILLDSKDIPDAQTTATTSAVVSDDPPPAYVDYASPIASGSGSRARDATSKVDIQLEANGPITARIHATSEGPRPFIHITARSDRPVTITVPRDFRGPLSISTPHSARLPADVTIFTEVQDTRHGFVGDFCDWTEESVGDSLALTSAGGTVTVQCEGEGAGAHSPQTWNPFAWAQMGAARRQAFHAHGALPRMASPSLSAQSRLHRSGLVAALASKAASPTKALNAVAHDNDLDTLRPLRGPIAGSRDDGDLDNLRPLRDLTAGTRDGDYPVIRRVPSLHNLNPRTPDDGLDMLRSLHNLSLGSSDRDLGHPDDAHHVGDVLERTPSLGLRPRRLRSRSRHSLSRGSRAPRPLAT
ncbi:hypothetical protein MSAN_02468000 [Mycena sanguinolenta]|uniref:DUF7330 domain-containing protein n=1 Tax=Mycena sanguinolenta TaxID=230812 RepID=A0A8H6WRW1_9AGAR|nr:hypothetical protein MSAN_02468000 [Mycena sanguinolenta]